jgi:hypothetical protein
MQVVAVVVFTKIVHRQDAAEMAELVAAEPDEEHQTELLLIEHRQGHQVVRECQGNGQLVAEPVAVDGTVRILKAESAVLELLL